MNVVTNALRFVIPAAIVFVGIAATGCFRASDEANNSDEDADSSGASAGDLGGAIMSGDPEMVATVLENGADVNATIANDLTALHLAALDGNPEMIAILVAAGAEIEAETASNMTPLLSAISMDQTENALALLDAGANVDTANRAGTTALIMAITGGQMVVVDALLTRGADPNAATKGHRTTPLIMASDLDDLELVKRLVQLGADKSFRDAYDKSAFDYAKSDEVKSFLSTQ